MTRKEKINRALENDGIVILPPMDVFKSMEIIRRSGIRVTCTMLDPWYNKGVGGELPVQEYDKFIRKLLNKSANFSDLIYLWGFPEIDRKSVV